jgi:hypothetical protein
MGETGFLATPGFRSPTKRVPDVADSAATALGAGPWPAGAKPSLGLEQPYHPPPYSGMKHVDAAQTYHDDCLSTVSDDTCGVLIQIPKSLSSLKCVCTIRTRVVAGSEAHLNPRARDLTEGVVQNVRITSTHVSIFPSGATKFCLPAATGRR